MIDKFVLRVSAPLFINGPGVCIRIPPEKSTRGTMKDVSSCICPTEMIEDKRIGVISVPCQITFFIVLESIHSFSSCFRNSPGLKALIEKELDCSFVEVCIYRKNTRPGLPEQDDSFVTVGVATGARNLGD